MSLSDLLRLAILLIGLLRTVQYLAVGDGPANQVMVTSNQLLNPAGRRIAFAGRPADLALSPNGDTVAVLVPGPQANTSTVQFYSPSGEPLQALKLPGGAPSLLGLAYSPDGKRIAAATTSTVVISSVSGGEPRPISFAGGALPAGVAFDPGGASLYVALNKLNQVEKVSLTGGTLGTVNVGVAPLGVAVAGDRLFVTNWGGRRPGAGEAAARSAGTPALIDSRGIASSGTVSVIERGTLQVTAEIPVGLHPSGIAVSPDGRLAAVANANSDTVSLIDTASLEIAATLEVPAYPRGFAGSSPTAVAFNSTGTRLYVACGGNNAVAVFERGDAFALIGFIPADWYPVAVAASSAGGSETVYVANAKGVGSRNSSGPFRVSQQTGSIGIAPGEVNDAAVSVANQPFANAVTPSGSPADLGALGIRYVFLIIKENRTYDQVLGDLGQGNGDPQLTLYGSRITPNQHRLALQFVTLDNFYASGVVSADGHNWLTQAFATDYLERSASASWPRSYPYSGDDPIAFASTGFIWNNARQHGFSARLFGEFAFTASGAGRAWSEFLADAEAPQRKLAVTARSQLADLGGILEPDYPGFTLNIPDVWRARLFIEKLAQAPPANLTIVQLPCDHTSGAAPNTPTPESMVADNDLAAGRIVEAIAKSSYWSQSAIFITEDDAQAGVDHVDGHRTLCLLASPYARRGAVDSTHYNHLSILRTIEELLGLPPMNKFDAAALPMRSAFVSAPDLTPYIAVQNQVALDRVNPSLAALNGVRRRAARDSMAMNFSVPDAAPEQKLNRILWHMGKGWKVRYPKVPHRRECAVEDDE